MFGEKEYRPGLIDGIGKGRPPGDSTRSIDEQVAEIRARGIDPHLAYLGNVDPDSHEAVVVDDHYYGEWEWHSDMSYLEIPPTFSLLNARVIPDEGGDTEFASQIMAAATLPPALRKQLAHAEIKHDSTYTSSGLVREGMAPPSSPIEAIGQPHPVLRRIPETDETALFLGRRTNAYVVGMPLDESEALLDAVWTHAVQPEFCYLHTWTVGQVVVWDNRTLMHKRHPVGVGRQRFMWRTQTRGDAVLPVVA
jgi:taurine dioxygenase